MAGKITEDGVDRSQEAHDLAVDAKEAAEHGDKEESEFLAKEAKKLDPEAAAAVLKKD